MKKYAPELFNLFPSKQKVRIERLLSTLGYVEFRNDTLSFLKHNTVTLDNQRIKKLGEQIELNKNGETKGSILLNGVPLNISPLHIIVNKPKGYMVTRSDPGSVGGDLIFDLLPRDFNVRSNPPLVAVGRLDKDSSGLIILTQIGALVNRLMSPQFHVNKSYEVTLKHDLTGKEAVEMMNGVSLKEENGQLIKCMPATFVPLEERKGLLTICEGKYHQIRRMFGALGNRVIELKRVQIGPLKLDEEKLPPGQYRRLEVHEVAALWNSPNSTATASTRIADTNSAPC